MRDECTALLKSKMSEKSYRKLIALENQKLFDFVGEYVQLCDPDTVYVCDDSDEDAEVIRLKALEAGVDPADAEARAAVAIGQV